MNMRAFVGATFLLLASCQWETHEVTSDSVQLYVPEENFNALKTGATADEVVKAIGAPREKQQGVQETWHYGVWRGGTPSFWNFLFGTRMEPATLLEGRVHFDSGRVVRVEIVESSAVSFPPRTRDR